MKNLFISMGEEIRVRNFVPGSFTYRKLSAEEIAPLIQSIMDNGGELSGYFDFGAVVSAEDTHIFMQLLDTIKFKTGVQLEKMIFKMKRDDDEPFPNFNFMPTVTDNQSMLVIEYYFSMDTAKALGEDNFGDFSTVSKTSMDFHLFEKSIPLSDVDQKSQKSGIDISKYTGSMKGKFGSVEEIDESIRKERDAWD